ncbi:glycoside-pentoside-hexuronide (GPH):cation symporter [Metabacillus bambusae]|uniref:MFS transporter n=1 Tax=Metabacillus bambusae TaxID=2795218 RepID=A0ABS3N851_9BACI|nr:glycoside-pentoside-hexuronide (GPH):cation symporter [Metabacillus bambusae]MBO1514088.1 MFS transporter [Metabacillus bambusae]
MSSQNASVKKSEIFLYSFGGFGSNLLFIYTVSFLMYFYTDVFKISPAAVGTVFLVVRLIDAFLDPLLGMLTDRTRSRWGTFRPWLIFGSPLLAMTTMLLFTAPDLSPSGKFAYAIATYVGYSFVSSIVNIPYHALSAVISKDPSQRNWLVTAKNLMGNLGGLAVSGSVLPLVAYFGSGQKGWFLATLLFSLSTIISYLLCAHGAKAHDTNEVITENALHSHNAHPSIKEQIKLISTNGPLLALLAATVVKTGALIINSAVAIYYWQYNMDRPDLYTQLFIWGTALAIPIYFVIPQLVKKYGKKNILNISCFITMLPSAILLMTPPENVMLIFVLSVLVKVLVPFTAVLPWMMLPDCVDFGKWKTGINGSATVHSTMIFTNKVGAAIGGLHSGALLGAAGYVAGQEQTPEALSMISNLYFLVPIIGFGVSLLLIWKFYPITNAIHSKILKEIDDKENNREAV